MQLPRSSSFVFAVVSVVALGSTVVATGLGGGAREHLAASSKKLAQGGARGTTPVLTRSMFGREELDAADKALTHGDRTLAAAHLAKVLDRVNGLDREHTVVTSLLASSLVDQVGKRVDAHPELLDSPYLVSSLRAVRLTSAKHPLAGERTEALAGLTRILQKVPVPTGGLAEWKTAQAMDQVDAALGEMETATIAKDRDACEAAAKSTHGLAGAVTAGPQMCALASTIVAGDDRLASLRTRAAARAHVTRL